MPSITTLILLSQLILTASTTHALHQQTTRIQTAATQTKGSANPKHTPSIVRRLRKYPYTQAAVALLVYGLKNPVRVPLFTRFKLLGIMHLFVISGAHLLILAMMIKRIFWVLARFAGVRVPQHLQAILLVFLCAGYCSLGQWQIPMTRAFSWLLVCLVAQHYQLKIDRFRSLILYVIACIVVSPDLALSRTWHLSIIATFFASVSLIDIFAYDKKMSKLDNFLIEFCHTSLISLAMAPIALDYFGFFSLNTLLYTGFFGFLLATVLLPLTLIFLAIQWVFGDKLGALTAWFEIAFSGVFTAVDQVPLMSQSIVVPIGTITAQNFYLAVIAAYAAVVYINEPRNDRDLSHKA